MANIKYILFLLFSVLISAISQVLLKKSAMEKHSSWVMEYINLKVIFAYILFFSAVLIDLIALKYVPVSFVPVIETSSYAFVIIFGKIFFKEYIGFKQFLAISLILVGIVVYIV